MLLTLTVRASAWLLQAAGTLPDTVVTRQIVELGPFDQVIHIAGGLLILLLLAGAIAVLPAALYLRTRLNQLTTALDGVRSDIGPLVNATSTVLENAEAISQRVRDDVERLSVTVEEFNGQLHEIADIASDRVRDFDALLGAIQEEAEALFLTSASAARGIRAGLRMLRGHQARRARRAALDEDESDDPTGDDLEEGVENEEAEPDVPRDRSPRLRRRRHAT